MRIGVFDHGWWEGACRALSHQAVALPVAGHETGNAYTADLAGRLEAGTDLTSRLAENAVDLLVDNGGTGLAFVRRDDGGENLDHLHEVRGKVLCSHFIDPLTTALQSLDWTIVWQCLQSQSWVKAVWDRAHAAEHVRDVGEPARGVDGQVRVHAVGQPHPRPP